MKTTLDCIPCLIRQSVEAARFVSGDEFFQKQIVETVLEEIVNTDLSKSPPALAQIIHRKIREISGIRDPYKRIKSEFNNLAMSMFEELAAGIDQSPDPLKTAVKLAVAGNVIDSGARSGLSENDIRDSVAGVFSYPLEGDIDGLCEKILKADSILYLADNAGEIFFDRLLLERLSHPSVTLAVRGCPVINDATIEDARAAGLEKFATVIENGSDAPGTVLDECSDEFMKHFTAADFVIAKGQGNYETLCDEKKDIFFLLKIKCPVIADHAGLPVGSNAVIRSAYYSNI